MWCPDRVCLSALFFSGCYITWSARWIQARAAHCPTPPRLLSVIATAPKLGVRVVEARVGRGVGLCVYAKRVGRSSRVASMGRRIEVWSAAASRRASG